MQRKNKDLDWLAFCYVADELSESERDEFELLLARDQAARDAVVRAMEGAHRIQSALELAEPTNQAIRVCEAKSRYGTSAWPRGKRTSGRAGLIGLATALLMIAAAGWSWHVFSGQADRDAVFGKASEELEEAAAWANLVTRGGAPQWPAVEAENLPLNDVVFEQNEEWMSAALFEMRDEEWAEHGDFQ
jgi:hypothetical protein